MAQYFPKLLIIVAILSLSAGCERTPGDREACLPDDEAISAAASSRYETGALAEQRSRGMLVIALDQHISDADVSVLVLGNSHVYTGDPVGQLERMLESANPNQKYFVHVRRGRFLVDLSNDQKTLDAIAAGPWNFVILQAQKYSMSGKYFYPTDGAVKLGKLAKKQGARVIMFPEWPRRGNTEEGPRVHRLHQSIAKRIDAEVAPVGKAWINAGKNLPKLNLYARDGNHSNDAGGCMTSAVLFCVMNQSNPANMPAHPVGELSAEDVLAIRKIAWNTYQAEMDERASKGRVDNRSR